MPVLCLLALAAPAVFIFLLLRAMPRGRALLVLVALRLIGTLVGHQNV